MERGDRTNRWRPSRNQKFVYETVVNLDQLEPTVACHPDPGQRRPPNWVT